MADDHLEASKEAGLDDRQPQGLEASSARAVGAPPANADGNSVLPQHPPPSVVRALPHTHINTNLITHSLGVGEGVHPAHRVGIDVFGHAFRPLPDKVDNRTSSLDFSRKLQTCRLERGAERGAAAVENLHT